MHPELPLDPDSPRPVHLRPTSWLWVFCGGILGTGMRWYLEQLMPTPVGGWPWATFAINLSGAVVLGIVLEALAGSDAGWRQRLRLFAGTGVCGAFTTYSTFALEISSLARHGDVVTGIAYGVVSVLGGVLGAWLGIIAASSARRVGSGTSS